MAKVVEGLESKGSTAESKAEAKTGQVETDQPRTEQVETGHPKPRVGILRQAFARWSNSLPCVQTFNADCAAQDRAAEAQKKAQEKGSS